ncbi:LysR family transcriptional regulator [Kribbella sandramycini]|uniref:DNA-binding transcriptional LysR family regulator n=1 Tax=Kribbella sandramycini TaxID=60450 RepID=A0A7Y4P004_9ACTN|nr:LysR family transcriptional regulator [Kribbella sandramycini]MBB6569541.1 DNA-binding transcriptional LysR family regulator [Kribbella sandramycini]NOL40625.1 LysR family transcriptional regulator [Kribbella sandramycini]
MDARHLRYFLAVVDHGTVSRAAEALYVAQPSLSQAIRALERELGAELFLRVGRRLVLTSAGTALIEPARQVVRGLEHAKAQVDSVSGLQAGRVEIAAMPSQSVDPLVGLIQACTERHPGLTISVRTAFTVDDVLAQVRGGESELGLLAAHQPIEAAGVDVHPLGSQRFVLVTPPDGPFTEQDAVQAEELKGHRLIVGQTGSGMRRVVDDIRDGGVELAEVVETEHREMILPLVLAGVGITVLTEAWAPLARRSGARVHPLLPPRELHLALVSRRDLTPAARAFIAAADNA